MFVCRVDFKIKNTANRVVVSAKNEKHLNNKMKLRYRKHVYKVKDIKYELLIG